MCPRSQVLNVLLRPSEPRTTEARAPRVFLNVVIRADRATLALNPTGGDDRTERLLGPRAGRGGGTAKRRVGSLISHGSKEL